LRERREDIPLLLVTFLIRLRGGSVPDGEALPDLVPQNVSAEALRLLMQHGWPGNVRELENALQHAHVLSRGGTILPEHLPPEVTQQSRSPTLQGVARHSETEKELIAAALARTGWNRSRAARRLGIDRSTLWRKIREYGLQPED
jgi:DNA-binding NtrC family response regulator